MSDKIKETVETIEGTPILSKLRSKLISRKLMVWVFTTIFFAMGDITSDQWMLYNMIYVGAQGSIDFVKMWRTTRPSDD